MNTKTVVEIEIMVTQVQVDEAGQEQRGFRHKVTVMAETPTFPSWDATAQTARALGRKAVRMSLDRDNMLVRTSEEEARLDPANEQDDPQK